MSSKNTLYTWLCCEAVFIKSTPTLKGCNIVYIHLSMAAQNKTYLLNHACTGTDYTAVGEVCCDIYSRTERGVLDCGLYTKWYTSIMKVWQVMCVSTHAGGCCHIDDVRHRSTHCVCGDWTDLQWPQEPQRAVGGAGTALSWGHVVHVHSTLFNIYIYIRYVTRKT